VPDNNQQKVLLADDEPFYLEWLDDFLTSKGIVVEYATSVDEAVSKLKSYSYRVVIVDLNIPMISAGGEYAKRLSGAYDTYPELYIANAARNAGYRTRQVIIYSVFSTKEIEEAASKLYCTFLTKMHPDDLKREIVHVLEYDPSQDT
jgi:CheY-like chemotaxis protein